MKTYTKDDMTDFFRDLVSRSLRGMPYHAELYVSKMLSDMSTMVYDEDPIGPVLFSPVSCSAPRLKEIGDRTLFMAGFFEERLERRGMKLSYYVYLSSSAYGTLAASFGEPFRSLASDTNVYRRALRDVRDMCDSMGMDMLSAYETWLQTRSRALEHRLVALGMVVGHDNKA